MHSFAVVPNSTYSRPAGCGPEKTKTQTYISMAWLYRTYAQQRGADSFQGPSVTMSRVAFRGSEAAVFWRFQETLLFSDRGDWYTTVLNSYSEDSSWKSGYSKEMVKKLWCIANYLKCLAWSQLLKGQMERWPWPLWSQNPWSLPFFPEMSCRMLIRCRSAVQCSVLGSSGKSDGETCKD